MNAVLQKGAFDMLKFVMNVIPVVITFSVSSRVSIFG